MKTMFIHARMEGDVLPVIKKALPKLPKKVGLLTTIQFLHKLDEVKDFLESNGIKADIGGQILGCDVSAAEKLDVDAFLYIGSGEFHPKALLLKFDKKIIQANPLTNEVSELDKSFVEKTLKRKKGMLVKFLSSKEIGVLVSLKPGQENYSEAKKLEKRFPDKNFYFFAVETLNFNDLENFPFIECWVNTMCVRLGIDDAAKAGIKMINLGDIE
jgi:2-(3-amino-3-carboxypropyl)histidine synthase